MITARIAVLRLIGSCSDTPRQSVPECSRASVRRMADALDPEHSLRDSADRHDLSTYRKVVEKRLRGGDLLRVRPAVRLRLPGAMWMRRHDVPEQNVLLQAELAQDAVDDRGAR